MTNQETTLNDQLILSKKCIDNLWRNLALLGQVEGIDLHSSTFEKEKDIQRMLEEYRLVRANLFTDDDIDNYVDGVTHEHIQITTNSCLGSRPIFWIEPIPPVYPLHRPDTCGVDDKHICLCGKKGIQREFLLSHSENKHQIVLGSKCILKYSGKDHPDYEVVETINKKLNDIARRREEQQIVKTHFGVTCLRPTTRTGLLEESTIRIISDKELYQTLGDRISFSYEPYKASYYYHTFILPKFNDGNLSRRDKQNIHKEPLFKYLKALTSR